MLIKNSFCSKMPSLILKAKILYYKGIGNINFNGKISLTEFSCGYTRMSEAKCSGRPSEVAKPETIEKLPEKLLDD